MVRITLDPEMARKRAAHCEEMASVCEDLGLLEPDDVRILSKAADDLGSEVLRLEKELLERI